MKKRIIVLLAAVMIFAATLPLSGCIHPDAEKLKQDTGVTMLLFSDGTDYYAQFIICGNGFNDITRMDDYFLNVLNTEFETEKISEPVTGENLYTSFGYLSKLKSSQWFFKTDPEVDYGLFSATVSYDYDNPFASVYEDGTPLNNIFKLFKNGGNGIEPLSEHAISGLYDRNGTYIGITLDNIFTKVLLPTKYNTKTDNGTIIYEPESRTHYYQIAGRLGETPNNRVEFTYAAKVSYGYFMVAVILGLLTVLLVLLCAKKKEGHAVDLSVNPQVFTEPYGTTPNNGVGNPYGGWYRGGSAGGSAGGDPFGEYGGYGASNGNSANNGNDNNNDNNSGGNSGNGGVFDGY